MRIPYFLYMRHEDEKERVIERIVDEAQNGNCDFSIDLEDDYSDDELEYIEEEVRRRLNGNYTVY